MFRAVRLTPLLGPAMLRAVDWAFPRYGLLTKQIRAGPLRGMILDVDPRALDMVIGRYEPTICAIFEETLGPGDVAFDVGANLGYFTLVMARHVGARGRVVSFEPNPAVMAALKRNIARDAAAQARIIPVQAAVGAAPGRASFAPAWRPTRGRVVAEGGEFEVEVTTLDAAAQRYGAPRLLKIDIEGAEIDALVGARELLEREHPVVVVEVHSERLEAQCRELLGRLGYACSRRADRGKGEAYLVAR